MKIIITHVFYAHCPLYILLPNPCFLQKIIFSLLALINFVRLCMVLFSQKSLHSFNNTHDQICQCSTLEFWVSYLTSGNLYHLVLFHYSHNKVVLQTTPKCSGLKCSHLYIEWIEFQLTYTGFGFKRQLGFNSAPYDSHSPWISGLTGAGSFHGNGKRTKYLMPLLMSYPLTSYWKASSIAKHNVDKGGEIYLDHTGKERE